MIDHLTLTVRDLDRARSFFAEALAPLGYALQMEFQGILGYGAPGKPALWLKAGPTSQAMHLAFVAPDHGAVDRFHAAAVAAGATDNGAPGLRPEYHAHYYGAFVIDPDGNNLEAVVHRAPGSAARKATIRAKAKKLAARRAPPARKPARRKRG
jgi:catechol 2,3-dioxygenase-like lactoylglutathione lyase family enzyme